MSTMIKQSFSATPGVLEFHGVRYVLLEEPQYEMMLNRLAATAEPLPELPVPDRDGSVPAAAFLRISVARDIIRERQALGLTQHELADLAGIPEQTLVDVEHARRSRGLRTIEKVEIALKKATASRAKKSRHPAIRRRTAHNNSL